MFRRGIKRIVTGVIIACAVFATMVDDVYASTINREVLGDSIESDTPSSENILVDALLPGIGSGSPDRLVGGDIPTLNNDINNNYRPSKNDNTENNVDEILNRGELSDAVGGISQGVQNNTSGDNEGETGTTNGNTSGNIGGENTSGSTINKPPFVWQPSISNPIAPSNKDEVNKDEASDEKDELDDTNKEENEKTEDDSNSVNGENQEGSETSENDNVETDDAKENDSKDSPNNEQTDKEIADKDVRDKEDQDEVASGKQDEKEDISIAGVKDKADNSEDDLEDVESEKKVDKKEEKKNNDLTKEKETIETVDKVNVNGVNVDDEIIPLADVPQTGDMGVNNWILLLLGSMCMYVSMLYYYKKKMCLVKKVAKI